MPVVVACRCGQRFAANEQLIGQQVPCPSCGNLLSIGAGFAGTPGIVISCGCGRAFSAPGSLRGKQTQCPACGGIIQVPGQTDPLAGGLPDLGGPLDTVLPLPVREPEIPWDTLKLIGTIGVTVLALVVGGVSIMNAMRQKPEIAEAKPAAPSETTAQGKAEDKRDSSAKASGSGKAPPTPPPPPAESQIENPFVPVTSEKPAAPVVKLPQGVQDWHTQPGTKLSGIRRVNPTDPALAQFSWMTGLLPFLGHQKIYDRFDFQKTLEEDRNVQVGATIVPEFLNPQDDYQRWRGYPFDGIALTHFVGISGVEDARNVVAAKLPRSDPRAGIFGYDEVARPEDITDGQSQTAMVAGAGALANPWVFGGGATIRGAREPLFDKTSGIGTKGLAGGGTIVMMADGSVRHVSAGVDPRVFKAMCTIRGGESVDLEHDSKPFDMHSLNESKK